jgi:hypothetical protein
VDKARYNRDIRIDSVLVKSRFKILSKNAHVLCSVGNINFSSHVSNKLCHFLHNQIKDNMKCRVKRIVFDCL